MSHKTYNLKKRRMEKDKEECEMREGGAFPANEGENMDVKIIYQNGKKIYYLPQAMSGPQFQRWLEKHDKPKNNKKL